VAGGFGRETRPWLRSTMLEFLPSYRPAVLRRPLGLAERVMPSMLLEQDFEALNELLEIGPSILTYFCSAPVTGIGYLAGALLVRSDLSV
jgi:hypothetical protein